MSKILATGTPNPSLLEHREMILVGHSIGLDLLHIELPQPEYRRTGRTRRSVRGNFVFRAFENVPILDTLYLTFGLKKKAYHSYASC